MKRGKGEGRGVGWELQMQTGESKGFLQKMSGREGEKEREEKKRGNKVEVTERQSERDKDWHSRTEKKDSKKKTN